MENRFTKSAIAGGVIVGLVIFAGTILLGEVSDYEAKVLINKSLSGLNTLCNTIILASATILALMLTLLGVGLRSKLNFDKVYYENILQVAKLDTIVIISGMIFFLIFNFPVTESENLPKDWHSVLYYVAIGLSGLLSGTFIVVVIMLYNTIKNIIEIEGFGMDDHPLVSQEMNEGKKDEDQDRGTEKS
jgi:hypothetical protein